MNNQILKISNVTKNFGGIRALDSCSLEIEKGKIVAIIGPNGSGKSTLFNAISGIIESDTGSIILEGKNISKMSDFSIARAGISRTFQDVKLFKNLTIKDHLKIALATKDERLLHSIFKEKESNENKINEILDLIGLDKPLDTYASDLSYGQRKLLDLAIAIAKPHKLLLFDEPVAGVNPKLRVKIKNILKELNKQGETILIIEHDMNFVMKIADYIFVLDEGRVIAKGLPKQIQENHKVLEAYLGE